MYICTLQYEKLLQVLKIWGLERLGTRLCCVLTVATEELYFSVYDDYIMHAGCKDTSTVM